MNNQTDSMGYFVLIFLLIWAGFAVAGYHIGKSKGKAGLVSYSACS